MKTLVNKLRQGYLAQPEILGKAERDFVIAFGGGLVASGAISQSYPDWHTAAWSILVSATLAGWRAGRKVFEPVS